MKNPMESVSPAMQDMADKSMQQAKKAFDTYIAGVRRALGAFGDNTPMASTGVREVGERALNMAERNIALSFTFARRFMQAKNFQEIMKLQSEYLAAQMQVLMEQTTNLSDIGGKTVTDPPKPKTE
jgi:phasin family protein